MNMRLGALGVGVALGAFWSLAAAGRVEAAPAAPAAGVQASAARTPPAAVGHLQLKLRPSREYGLAGLSLRLGLARPVAPYVEAHAASGAGGARPDGALMIPGTPLGLNGVAGSTWMNLRGVDLGVDVLRRRDQYLCLAVGWVRSTWSTAGFDARDRLLTGSVARDGVLLKLGFSF